MQFINKLKLFRRHRYGVKVVCRMCDGLGTVPRLRIVQAGGSTYTYSSSIKCPVCNGNRYQIVRTMRRGDIKIGEKGA